MRSFISYFLSGLALLAMMSIPLSASAQSGNASKPVSVHIEKDIIPPQLEIVPNSIQFKDGDGNNTINANEKSSIVLEVKNVGKGDAYGCTAQIIGEGSIADLSFPAVNVPIIKSGETVKLEFPIHSGENTVNGVARFIVSINEPNGFAPDPVQLQVSTHKVDHPFVEMVSYKVISEGKSELKKKQPFKLQLLIQNTDYGMARDVTCSFKAPNGLYITSENDFVRIDSLRPNERYLIEYELLGNQNVADELNLKIDIKESYGRFAKNADVKLIFGQSIHSEITSIDVQSKSSDLPAIEKGSLVSEVDENIPLSESSAQNSVALIIANESYQQVVPVPFALNDGSVFRQYCEKTIGVPVKQIKYYPNATGNQIKSAITWLQNVTDVIDDAEVIVYYAGHGIPDEKTKSAYLLPVDGIGNDVSTGYLLDDLYSALSKLKASRIIVFMDACFTGSRREEGMINSESRAVALPPSENDVEGSMVVFTASQGTETAYPLRDEGHGLFTYYLLKKLQESGGDVTLKELSEYIRTNVSKRAILDNNKPQTPSVKASEQIGEIWENWKL